MYIWSIVSICHSWEAGIYLQVSYFILWITVDGGKEKNIPGRNVCFLCGVNSSIQVWEDIVPSFGFLLATKIGMRRSRSMMPKIRQWNKCLLFLMLNCTQFRVEIFRNCCKLVLETRPYLCAEHGFHSHWEIAMSFILCGCASSYLLPPVTPWPEWFSFPSCPLLEPTASYQSLLRLIPACCFKSSWYDECDDARTCWVLVSRMSCG